MHGGDLLKDIGLAILGAALVGIPAHLVRAPLLLAYLAAGVVLGPHLGLGLIQNAENISMVSSIGLVLLMFILGLEIDIKKLLQAGKAVAANGVTQFLGCALLAVGFFALFGYGVGNGRYDLVYLAVACSLSSTLVVVRVLSDRMELGTLTSRITLGILVLQDLWAIAFLAIQPDLNNLEATALLFSLGRAVLLIGISAAIARFVLPSVFAKVARSPELLLVAAVAWCTLVCGIAGMLHLSLEMGGLIAGVAIASFPYHVEIAAKISSLRDFFITLFFVGLGLQIPQPTIAILLLAGMIIVFVLFSRLLTVFPVLYSLGYGNRGSLIPALNLSQVSEFALVLSALGMAYGHVDKDLLSAFIIAFVITAMLSSMTIPNSHAIYRFVNPWLEKLGLRDNVAHVEAKNETKAEKVPPRVVLLGFYREASSLLQEMILRHSDAALEQILVIDFNPEAHHDLAQLGVHAKYGDISHPDTLTLLGLEKAKILVCTLPDQMLKGTSNLKLLRILKRMAPEAKIVVTAETFESARLMYAEGAAYVFIPRLLASHHLADVLEQIDTGAEARLKNQEQAFLKDWKEIIP